MKKNGPMPMMQPMPFQGMVKKLIIAHAVIWIFFQLVLEGIFFPRLALTTYFGLVPFLTTSQFYIWQVFTYMFLHSRDVWHIVFNMLLLWMLGTELESRWGKKMFLSYYLTCGVGAGIIYILGYLISRTWGGGDTIAMVPVVGASGAVFGLLLAYGMVFGERMMYFFFVFPMKAKYFVMILGGVEILMMLSGGQAGIANLAHIGGLITGFLYLYFWTRKKQRSRNPRRPKLSLVIDNEKPDDDGKKYWN